MITYKFLKKQARINKNPITHCKCFNRNGETHLSMRLEGFKRAYVKRVGRRLFVRMFDHSETIQFNVERMNNESFSQYQSEKSGL